MNNILEIKDLCKTYYTKLGCVEALRNINLNIHDGEIIGIIGNSGCGKSTLLSILAKLDEGTSGDIKSEKKDYVVGYMLQNDALFPWLTILDNATLGLKIKNIKTKENIEYTKQLLETYGLKDFMYKYPNSLSGGMKQRVALIRTLAIKPDILLLDEPFSKLDLITRLDISDDVYKMIKQEKKTTIIISHDIGECVSLCDRVAIMTKRPGTIKKIYDINLLNKDIPSKVRTDEKFYYYYDLLWKEIDK
ncbi:MAG: ABC transporter ATP-binding protein [Bacilli bacterium]|nr:ABC transporter ATP-binding protein [Bacilli bacterium]